MTDPRNVSLFDVDNVTEFGPVRDMTVTPVSGADVDEFCRRWHYSHHKGAACWNYGLWDGYTLVGVVSYNQPQRNAAEAVMGADMWESVSHMGRLVCAEDAPRNVESRLIAESLRLFKQDRPVVRAVLTFAAQEVGHIGYVYQATNALYCGTTSPELFYIDKTGRRRTRKQNGGPKGNGDLHPSEALRLGWQVHRGQPKHRYIYLLGNRTERREALRLLRYTPQPYPKAGDS